MALVALLLLLASASLAGLLLASVTVRPRTTPKVGVNGDPVADLGGLASLAFPLASHARTVPRIRGGVQGWPLESNPKD